MPAVTAQHSKAQHDTDRDAPAAGDMFPSSYNMSIINAQHGSWDRTPPLGYRVMVLNLNDDGLAANYSALADGWLLPNGTAWGRSSFANCACLRAQLSRLVQTAFLCSRCPVLTVPNAFIC